MPTILVVDDERNTRESIATILNREGHDVASVPSAEAALEHLAGHEADLILSDVKMAGMDGLTLLRRIKAQYAGSVVVMMSGHNDITAAVGAMKDGAFDYLVKPFGKNDVLRVVQKGLTLRSVLVENIALKRQVEDQFAKAHVIGSSPAWRQVCQTVEQVSPSRSTILIMGESGTGKELIAQLVHHLSPRAEQPFVTLNAAALPDALVEAELFGYEKGAFTGAMQRKPGRFELADGGTLFLDEIGELPLSAQAKLLRVLQEGTFERLGGTRTQKVDVRIVVATHRDLPEEIAAKRFREDLYYRINVISIALPPLRERREDIPLLLTYFLRKYADQNGKAIVAAQRDVIERLQAYHWPGNVRELENTIERAVVLARQETISIAELPPHLQSLAPESQESQRGERLMTMQRPLIQMLSILLRWEKR